jgi:hypothetical protein
MQQRFTMPGYLLRVEIDSALEVIRLVEGAPHFNVSE